MVRVLLAGYHGQENLGDDLTDVVALWSLVQEFGEVELHLLNFGSPPRHGQSQVQLVQEALGNLPGLRDRIKSIVPAWFDVLESTRMDLVVVDNGGLLGAGKSSFELGAIAAAKGVPFRYLCLKEYVASGFYGDFQRSVLGAAQHAIFRDEDHLRAFQAAFLQANPTVFAGIDLAMFVPALLPRRDPHGACLLFPRWNADPVNAASTQYLNGVLDRHPGRHFILMAASQQDANFFRSFWHRRNMTILSVAHTALDEICRVIASAEAAISTGRLHGVVVPLSYGVRSAFVPIGPGGENHKVTNFCREFGVPYLSGAPEDVDAFLEHGRFPESLPRDMAIRDRFARTLARLPGLSAPTWLEGV